MGESPIRVQPVTSTCICSAAVRSGNGFGLIRWSCSEGRPTMCVTCSCRPWSSRKARTHSVELSLTTATPRPAARAVRRASAAPGVGCPDSAAARTSAAVRARSIPWPSSVSASCAMSRTSIGSSVRAAFAPAASSRAARSAVSSRATSGAGSPANRSHTGPSKSKRRTRAFARVSVRGSVCVTVDVPSGGLPDTVGPHPGCAGPAGLRRTSRRPRPRGRGSRSSRPG